MDASAIATQLLTIGRATSVGARELAGSAHVIGTSVLGIAAPSRRRGPELTVPAALDGPAATLVVLVHGFGADGSCWSSVIAALADEGATIATFRYGAFGTGVEELAHELSRATKRLIADVEPTVVHLVGHSLGGVVVAHAMTDELLARRVDQVITIGSPFQGCSLAALLPVTEAVRDLRVGSAVLTRLATSTTAARTRWISISSTLDLVVPPSRARLEHAAEHVVVDDAGHCGLLGDPTVIEQLRTRTSRATSGRAA